MSEQDIKPVGNYSIRTKLILLTVGISGLTLFIASGIQLAYGIIQQRESLVDDLVITAEILGNQSIAALEFLDTNAAEEILASAKAVKSMTLVCIYDSTGEVFSHYAAKASNGRPTVADSESPCPPVSNDASFVEDDRISIYRTIVDGENKLGTVHIQSNLEPIKNYTDHYVFYVGIILVCALLLAYALSWYMQGIISTPVYHLVKTAKRITDEKDYSIRAQRLSGDELGILVDEFNTMLSRVQERDAALVNAKETAELMRVQADAANISKSEFLANMSHELRTPLNSLLILAENMLENGSGNLSEDQLEDMDVIYRGGTDLLNLINEILDLAKVEAGKIDLNLEEISLNLLVENMIRQFSPVAKEKGITFNVELSDGAPTVIRSDELRLCQVLRNLISNAIKFTHKGGVTLRIARPDSDWVPNNSDTDPDEMVAFLVIDTGIGIPVDRQEKIFQTFEQADGTTTREYGGTGLGLSIAREFTELLGGEIRLESTIGEGSTFILYLPQYFELDESMQTQDFDPDYDMMPNLLDTSFDDDRENLTITDTVILIVEDDNTFAQILRDKARTQGMKCIIASCGQEGFELAQDYHPHAAIINVELSDIDGRELYDRFVEMQSTSGIQVYFSSIYDQAAKEKSGSVLGTLVKPVDNRQLENVFVEIEDAIRDVQ